ncbi:MAG: hypothetical protein O2780_02975 [Proteobacteria bacterium]|nr:hypothetical protein [Pseudomonadota bacterium]
MSDPVASAPAPRSPQRARVGHAVVVPGSFPDGTACGQNFHESPFAEDLGNNELIIDDWYVRQNLVMKFWR